MVTLYSAAHFSLVNPSGFVVPALQFEPPQEGVVPHVHQGEFVQVTVGVVQVLDGGVVQVLDGGVVVLLLVHTQQEREQLSHATAT